MKDVQAYLQLYSVTIEKWNNLNTQKLKNA